jgi:DEAD/DEAH box helicase domain-containing protein
MAGKRVFVLGWDDLPEQGKAPPIAAADVLLAARDPNMLRNYDSVIAEKNSWLHSAALSNFLTESNFRWLQRWLNNPDETAVMMQQAALANLLSWLKPTAAKPPLRETCLAELQHIIPSVVMVDVAEGKEVWGGLLSSLGQVVEPVRVFCRLPAEAMQSLTKLVSEAEIHLNIDDTKAEHTKQFSQKWRSFWQAFNLLQFAPRFTVTTRTGVAQHGYDSALQHWPLRGLPSQQEFTAENSWQLIVSETMIDPVSMALLIEANLPVPEVGADLFSGDAIIGAAELSWPDRKVALFLDKAEVLPFVPGWQVISIQSADWLPLLCQMLAVNEGIR